MYTVDKWYKYEPKTVEEKNNTTILYDNVMPIHTDRKISANRSDIVIKKTIGIRNALSLMWLYPPKNSPSIKILKKKSPECGR